MKILSCIVCGKEFTPLNDGRFHAYCSAKCQRKHRKEKLWHNKQFRQDLELPPAKFCTSHIKKVESDSTGS